MDQLTAMKTFTRVVETGSFTEVARELNTTQSTISKRIAMLEFKLGTKLLIRSSRNQVQTEAGADFYERSLRVLAEMAEAESAVASLTESPRGRLRVNLPISFGRLHITPLIPRFMELYPDISFDFIMSDRNIDLIGEGVDVAIRIGELYDSSLHARQFGVNRRLLAAKPEYFEEHGVPKSPKDLKHHNCMVYTLLHTGNIWHFKRRGKNISVQVSGNFRSDNSDAIKEIVMAGKGIFVFSAWLIQPELESGALQPVKWDYTPTEIPINALYPQNRFVPLKVRCFIDFLKERFENDPLFN